MARSYLSKMPSRVLFGMAMDIEGWCFENMKPAPTLRDLDAERNRRKRKGKRK